MAGFLAPRCTSIMSLGGTFARAALTHESWVRIPPKAEMGLGPAKKASARSGIQLRDIFKAL